MKTIGLLGGMSWESSAVYYRLINEAVRDRLGPLRSARLLLLSYDFGEIEQLQHTGRWDAAGALLAAGARSLEAGGADCVLLCTNTMHKVADSVAAATSLPFLHIADATATAVAKLGARKVGLLGTGFTMEQDFFRGRLRERYGLEVLIPEKEERDGVHRIIYSELCAGHVIDSSRAFVRGTISGMVSRGAEAILLSCTELMLLVGRQDATVPLVDSTAEHAAAAVAFALDELSK
jgi:aspartate racemase